MTEGSTEIVRSTVSTDFFKPLTATITTQSN